MLLIECRFISSILIIYLKNRMDILKKLGSNIREQRTKLDLSQEMLANNAEIHRTYLGAVERGEKNVSFKNLYKIAKALKVSVSDLTKLI